MKLDVSMLKQMAPSMKWAISVSVVSLVLGGLVSFFGLRREWAAIKASADAIHSLNARANQMRADIDNADTQKRAAEKAAAELDTLVASGVIEPLLGSFAMRGKALLDPIAQQTGFRIENVRELSPIPLQLPKQPPEQLHYRQPIEFTGQGSYTQIIAFIAQTEEANPMVTLSSLLILGQPQSPETHKAILSFEWPAKGEKSKPSATLKK